MTCEQFQNLDIEVNHNEVFFSFVPKTKLKVIGQGGLEVLMWPTPQVLLSNLKNRRQLFIGSCNHKPSLVMKLSLQENVACLPVID